MRVISHTECVYAAGDADAAEELFGVLGFAVSRRPGSPFMVVHVEPDAQDPVTNCLYASEVTASQWAFELALRTQLDADPELQRTATGWEQAFKDEPQRSYHLGFRYDGRQDLEQTLERVRIAGGVGGSLAGRVQVTGVYFPGDQGSITDSMAQAFVWTDIVASGLLAFGQHLELQWHLDATTDPPVS